MLTTLVVSAIAVWLTAYLLPGITIAPWWAAFIVATVLGVINTFIRPVVKFLSFPVTFMALGLFTLVINGLMVLLCAWFLDDYFKVDGFLWAMLYSIVLSVVTWVLQLVFDDDK